MTWATLHIPWQLKRPEFRFYKVGTNSKIPLETGWNNTCNYAYNDPSLLVHQGNYGICTGFGNLIVLDVDDEQYAQSDTFTRILPKTFTVLSAGKRLPHKYYILKGEMIDKTNIRAFNGVSYGKTLLDIQAAKVGVIGPNSSINNKYYQIVDDSPIAEIDIELLQREFKIKPTKNYIMKQQNPIEYQFTQGACENTLRALKLLGIKRTLSTLHQCPFHEMIGHGNLNVFKNTGALYCFHEQKYWHSIELFQLELEEYGKKTIRITTS